MFRRSASFICSQSEKTLVHSVLFGGQSSFLSRKCFEYISEPEESCSIGFTEKLIQRAHYSIIYSIIFCFKRLIGVKVNSRDIQCQIHVVEMNGNLQLCKYAMPGS